MYQGISNGLYLCHRNARKLGFIKHHALLDLGNVLRNPKARGTHPIIYHQTIKGLRIEYLGSETWMVDVGNPIVDLERARARILDARKNPKYDLFQNNCQHFVNRVAKGKNESEQLQVVGAIVVIGALVAVVANADKKTKKRTAKDSWPFGV